MYRGEEIGKRVRDQMTRNPGRAVESANRSLSEFPALEAYSDRIQDVLVEESRAIFERGNPVFIAYVGPAENAFMRAAALGYASGMHSEISLDYLPAESVNDIETDGDYVLREIRDVNAGLIRIEGTMTIPSLRLREGSQYTDLVHALEAAQEYRPLANPYKGVAQASSEAYANNRSLTTARINEQLMHLTKLSIVGFFMSAYDVAIEKRK